MPKVKRIFRGVFILTGMAAFMWGAAQPGFAQTSDVAEEVIQTEISLDQAVDSQGAKEGAASQGDSNVPLRELTPDEQKEKMINESLKNALEENKKLEQDNKAMEDELKQLRGTSEINANRIQLLNNQRENLQKQVVEIEMANKQYQSQMVRLNATMADKIQELNQKLADMEKQIADKEAESQKAMTTVLDRMKNKSSLVTNEELAISKKQAEEDLKKLESQSQRVASQVAKVALENKKMKVNSAKLHYNLANTFFERGDYTRAAAEYKQVVEFLPYDADAHYNLAFVYGEFLNNPGAALEHYKMYLHLNPYASDAPLVKEKILETELSLKSQIPSPTEDILNRESRKDTTSIEIKTAP